MNSLSIKTVKIIIPLLLLILSSCSESKVEQARERLLINEGWKFYNYASMDEADDLIYDVRPDEIQMK